MSGEQSKLPVSGTGGEGEKPIQVLREVLFKTQTWQISLRPSAIEFDLQGEPGKDGKTHISLPRSKANLRLKTEGGFGRNFRKLNGKFSGTILYIKPVTFDSSFVGMGVQYEEKFLISQDDWLKIRSWLAETPEEVRQPAEKEARTSLDAEIRGQGIIYILLGIAHFVFSNALEPAWGVVLILIGILDLAIPNRGLFILNGIALLLVGIWNAVTGELAGSFVWRMLGVAQVVWGLTEFSRFGHYGSTLTPPPAPLSKSRPLKEGEVDILRLTMEQKYTDELLAILNAENKDQYLPEALEAVRLVLKARGVKVPGQEKGVSNSDTR
jgi:hypothetical protein